MAGQDDKERDRNWGLEINKTKERNRTGNGDKIKENYRKGTGHNVKGKGQEMYRTRDSKKISNRVFEDSIGICCVYSGTTNYEMRHE